MPKNNKIKNRIIKRDNSDIRRWANIEKHESEKITHQLKAITSVQQRTSIQLEAEKDQVLLIYQLYTSQTKNIKTDSVNYDIKDLSEKHIIRKVSSRYKSNSLTFFEFFTLLAYFLANSIQVTKADENGTITIKADRVNSDIEFTPSPIFNYQRDSERNSYIVEENTNAISYLEAHIADLPLRQPTSSATDMIIRDDLKELYQAIVKLIEEDKNKEAIDLCEQYLKENPQDTMVRRLLAKCYTHANEFTDAKNQIAKARADDLNDMELQQYELALHFWDNQNFSPNTIRQMDVETIIHADSPVTEDIARHTRNNAIGIFSHLGNTSYKEAGNLLAELNSYDRRKTEINATEGIEILESMISRLSNAPYQYPGFVNLYSQKVLQYLRSSQHEKAIQDLFIPIFYTPKPVELLLTLGHALKESQYPQWLVEQVYKKALYNSLNTSLTPYDCYMLVRAAIQLQSFGQEDLAFLTYRRAFLISAYQLQKDEMFEFSALLASDNISAKKFKRMMFGVGTSAFEINKFLTANKVEMSLKTSKIELARDFLLTKYMLENILNLLPSEYNSIVAPSICDLARTFLQDPNLKESLSHLNNENPHEFSEDPDQVIEQLMHQISITESCHAQQSVPIIEPKSVALSFQENEPEISLIKIVLGTLIGGVSLFFTTKVFGYFGNEKKPQPKPIISKPHKKHNGSPLKNSIKISTPNNSAQELDQMIEDLQKEMRSTEKEANKLVILINGFFEKLISKITQRVIDIAALNILDELNKLEVELGPKIFKKLSEIISLRLEIEKEIALFKNQVEEITNDSTPEQIKQLIIKIREYRTESMPGFEKSYAGKYKGIDLAIKHLPPQGQPLPPQDQPLPPQDQPLPPQDQPLPPQGQPLPPQGQPLPPQDQPLPPQDQPLPPQDQPLPPQGQPLPPQDQPLPIQGQQSNAAPTVLTKKSDNQTTRVNTVKDKKCQVKDNKTTLQNNSTEDADISSNNNNNAVEIIVNTLFSSSHKCINKILVSTSALNQEIPSANSRYLNSLQNTCMEINELMIPNTIDATDIHTAALIRNYISLLIEFCEKLDKPENPINLTNEAGGLIKNWFIDKFREGPRHWPELYTYATGKEVKNIEKLMDITKRFSFFIHSIFIIPLLKNELPNVNLREVKQFTDAAKNFITQYEPTPIRTKQKPKAKSFDTYLEILKLEITYSTGFMKVFIKANDIQNKCYLRALITSFSIIGEIIAALKENYSDKNNSYLYKHSKEINDLLEPSERQIINSIGNLESSLYETQIALNNEIEIKSDLVFILKQFKAHDPQKQVTMMSISKADAKIQNLNDRITTLTNQLILNKKNHEHFQDTRLLDTLNYYQTNFPDKIEQILNDLTPPDIALLCREIYRAAHRPDESVAEEQFIPVMGRQIIKKLGVFIAKIEQASNEQAFDQTPQAQLDINSAESPVFK